LELDEIKKLAVEISAKGPETVLFTRGPKGAVLYKQGNFYMQGVIPTEVVDTLGAGDSFIARLLVGILKEEKIEAALQNAAKAAADVCKTLGAYGYGVDIQ
jgi:fructoselysine 6-kinase